MVCTKCTQEINIIATVKININDIPSQNGGGRGGSVGRARDSW